MAELVVPRSMPIFIGVGSGGRAAGWRRSRLYFLPDVELQFPAAAVAGDAPELQHAGLGDYRFEGDRDDLGGVFAGTETHFHRGEFLEVVSEILDEVAGFVVL